MTGTQTDRRQIEAAVLGAMVLSADAAEFAVGELSGSEFALSDHRAIWTAICSLHARGVPTDDPVTIADELSRHGQFESAGGALGIANILEAVPHAAHVRHYVTQLQEHHQRDQLALLSDRMRRSAQDPTAETSATISNLISELEAIRAGALRRTELVSAQQALQQYDDDAANPAAIVPTGIGDLDRILRGGLRAGQLVVIGGRPGLGKSALMSQMLLNAAKSHRAAMLASLEMTPGEIAGRATRTIPRERFAGLPVWFSEAGDIAKLVSLIRLAKRSHNIELAAVDYLQLIDSPIGKNELRERQVATMSRGLKRLAVELRLPILLGSQLNRESEKRGRPSLSDLRESGAIEQDADIVCLLSGDAESADREIIVAKHRNGSTGLVRAEFDGPKFLFRTESDPWTGDL